MTPAAPQRGVQPVVVLPLWPFVAELLFWVAVLGLCLVGLAVLKVVRFFVRTCQSVIQST